MVVFGHENRCMQVNAILQNVAVAAAALQVSSRGHDHLHIIATGAPATAAFFIGPTLDPYAAVRPSLGIGNNTLRHIARAHPYASAGLRRRRLRCAGQSFCSAWK